MVQCKEGEDKTSELDKIYHEATQIQCELLKLRNTIAVSWDNVNDVLDENLPEQIPAEERTNILKVRNASLIRMFETYKELDDTVKMKVDEVETRDRVIAQKIVKYRQRLMVLDNMKHEIIGKMVDSKKSLNFEDYPALSDIKPIDCL